MHITPALLSLLTTGWSAAFKVGFDGAETHYKDIALVTKSNTAETGYPFLGQMPGLREWLGERRIKQLAVHGFSIKNRKFEETIGVRRTDIEDDVAGVYTPMFEELGRDAARHPDKLIFELVAAGFVTACYDNQNFFDTDHPGKNEAGEDVLVSNVQEGDGPTWYLLDNSRAIRPFIFQERLPCNNITRVDQDSNPHVFSTDEYIYGLRGRSNAGFGLWQLAYASKAPLTVANYEAARTAMMAIRGDEGHLLGVKPTTLLVPSPLEGDGRRVVVASNLAGGESNIWHDTAKLISTHWLS